MRPCPICVCSPSTLLIVVRNGLTSIPFLLGLLRYTLSPCASRSCFLCNSNSAFALHFHYSRCSQRCSSFFLLCGILRLSTTQGAGSLLGASPYWLPSLFLCPGTLALCAPCTPCCSWRVSYAHSLPLVHGCSASAQTPTMLPAQRCCGVLRTSFLHSLMRLPPCAYFLILFPCIHSVHCKPYITWWANTW